MSLLGVPPLECGFIKSRIFVHGRHSNQEKSMILRQLASSRLCARLCVPSFKCYLGNDLVGFQLHIIVASPYRCTGNFLKFRLP